MISEKARRILIVDDETPLCEVLKTRLEGFGYSVSVAFNGRQGWQELLANPPDVVLLDIRMPEEDGYTFLRKVRSFRDPEDSGREEQVRRLPVIVMTATGEGMKPLFEQERISAYVTKPIDSSALKKLIEETLNPL
jgi:CheY-like chemotaxis protein